jgi:hypothetical protein
MFGSQRTQGHDVAQREPLVVVRCDRSPYASDAALANTSFTLVRNELDLIWETSAGPARRAARHLVKSPQCVRVNMCESDRLRWPNTVGVIPHGGK